MGSLIIDGGPGTDFIIGGPGNDGLGGGPDADIIWGGNGNDLIDGGPGDDTIYAGTGLDMLWGGPGRDTFVFNSNQPGTKYIMDFEPGDRIDVRGVDGFFEPDEEYVFEYIDSSLVPGSEEMIERANDIFDDVGSPARLIRGSVLVAGIGEGLDEGRFIPPTDPRFGETGPSVVIFLNGMSVSNINDAYFGDYDGGAWIA